MVKTYRNLLSLCDVKLYQTTRPEHYATHITSVINDNNTDLQNFTFFLAETKWANSYVNWAAEHENHNENASLVTVVELSCLTCTT
jgi:hypothetical protein